ncbi:hypothetical protein PspLS_02613 [Pyricularia sp. CBS 133598]|nr:hypothetical protein PspLS_02613 [Pyricularia sp. CBS 133598]
MGSIPQSPSVTKPIGSLRRRDTGFPEPFCGQRNTTLPHPDAIVSPDACITADDISVSKARTRRSLLHSQKYKHTLSHGRISPNDMYRANENVMVDSDGDSPVPPPIARMPSIITNSTGIRPSTKDSYDDRRSSHPISELSMVSPSTTSSSSGRRKSLFRKFRWNRD